MLTELLAPIVIVVSGGSFDEAASVPRPLLESCNAAFRTARCVERSSVEARTERAFLALVEWSGDNARTVAVRVQGEARGVPASSERRLSFEPTDTLEDRQRAVGLVIAATVIALVTETESENSATNPTNPETPRESAAAAVPPKPAVLPPKPTPTASLPSTGHLADTKEPPASFALELFGGASAASGLDAAGFRVGPMLRLSLGPAPALWFGVVEGRLETAVSGPRSSATRLAAGFGLTPFGGDWGRFLLEAELIRLEASAVDEAGREESVRLTRAGARSEVEVAVPVSQQVKLGWGAGVSALWPSYDLEIGGVGRGGETVLGWSTHVGFRLRLK